MTEKYNLVIPMAGLGSRFSREGYKVPKPLLPIGRYRMFEVVVANLTSQFLHEVSIVAPKEFDLSRDCESLSSHLGRAVHLTEIDHITDGPASTALIGLGVVNANEPLVIANSDQFLDFDPSNWILEAISSGSTGSILCMEDNDPKWSFARMDDSGAVLEVAEKQVISNLATCGVYFFKSGNVFETAAQAQQENNFRVNGEFYVGPSYNQIVASGGRVETYNLGPVSEVMFGLGVPADYESFVSSALLVSKANSMCDRWLQ